MQEAKRGPPLALVAALRVYAYSLHQTKQVYKFVLIENKRRKGEKKQRDKEASVGSLGGPQGLQATL